MKFVLALLFLAGLACAQDQQSEGPNADPKAAADAYYGYYGYPGYGGYGGRYYGGYGGYYNRGYGYYGRKKRDAEADPAVLATTHAAPAVVPHLGYGLGHLGYAYGAPYLHHAVPHTYTVAHKDAVVTPGAVDVKVHAPVYAGHFGYGLPYAGHLGYAYGGYGLPVVAAAAAAPAVADARKKRDAEAEPEADADAAAEAYYGYYGHPGYYGGYGGYRGYYGGYGGYYGRGYGYGGYRYGWGK